MNVKALATPRTGAYFVWALVLCLLFRGYWQGITSPGWDFLGGYLTNAFAWWNNGSFFQPPEYLPNLASGYPSAANAQSSGWYLPVGLAANLFDYNSWTAAVLQSLTIAAGSLGAGAVARRLGASSMATVLAALGYLLSPGFFGQSQHVDIVRGWAFAPWLLFVLLPKERYGPAYVLGSTLLWWQFLIGSYPGSVVALFYLCGLWVLLGLGTTRDGRLRYLLFSLTPVLLGAAMSTLKWIPYLAVGSGDSGEDWPLMLPDSSSIASMVASAADPVILGDPSLRSFFVVPSILMLAILGVGVRDRIALYATATVALALLLGLASVELDSVTGLLPLMSLSRFRIYDFNIGLYLGLALGAAGALTALVRARRVSTALYLTAAVIPLASLAFAARIGVQAGNLAVAALGIGMCALPIAFLWMISAPREHPDASEAWRVRTADMVALMAVATTAVVGFIWAMGFQAPWNADRHASELYQWNATSEQLIDSGRADPAEARDVRTGPPIPSDPGTMVSQFWNGAELSGDFSSAGYANLKGNWRGRQYLALAASPDNAGVFDLLDDAPEAWLSSAVVPTDSAACLKAGTCTVDGQVEVVEWTPARIALDVNVQRDAILTVNEVAWPGWSIETCDATGGCSIRPLIATEDDFLLSASVPAGTSRASFTFETPGMKTAWVIFWVALSSALLFALLAWPSTRSQGRPRRSSLARLRTRRSTPEIPSVA